MTSPIRADFKFSQLTLALIDAGLLSRARWNSCSMSIHVYRMSGVGLWYR